MIFQMTLREAIQKFHGDNSLSLTDRKMSDEAQAFFQCHDIAHVVFGCDTSIIGEGQLKIWILFGTTLGFFNHLKGYSQANAFTLFRQYSIFHVLTNISKLVWLIPRTIFRARCMSKKWNWSDYERYMDIPLVKIREEFNIKDI